MIDSSMPLLNKKILVPRGEKEAKSFSQVLQRYGGITVEIPLIAFRPKPIDEELQACLQVLQTYDWVVFTSNVTVETFLSILGTNEITPKVAVIGKRTKKILEEKGLAVSFLPSEYVAETFVREFLPCVHDGMKILIPKGNLARDYIAENLRKAGAAVDEVIVYETYMPDQSRSELANRISRNELDILFFTSPSTVDHFMDVIKEGKLETNLAQCLIGCIGPVSEKKIKSYGLPVHASPKEYTVEEMIKSMNSFILEKSWR